MYPEANQPLHLNGAAFRFKRDTTFLRRPRQVNGVVGELGQCVEGGDTMEYARLKAALGLTFLAVLGPLPAEPGQDDKSPVIAVSERTVEPLLKADRPWEDFCFSYCQVLREGDKWHLVIPSDLAYGARGAGDGLIPPNQTLIFDMELLSTGPARRGPPGSDPDDDPNQH